jgi:hypothetical protein
MLIAGCRWYLPINGTTNSNAAGASRQVKLGPSQSVDSAIGLEALAHPLCRSNSDAAEIQKLAGAFDLGK